MGVTHFDGVTAGPPPFGCPARVASGRGQIYMETPRGPGPPRAPAPAPGARPSRLPRLDTRRHTTDPRLPIVPREWRRPLACQTDHHSSRPIRRDLRLREYAARLREWRFQPGSSRRISRLLSSTMSPHRLQSTRRDVLTGRTFACPQQRHTPLAWYRSRSLRGPEGEVELGCYRSDRGEGRSVSEFSSTNTLTPGATSTGSLLPGRRLMLIG